LINVSVTVVRLPVPLIRLLVAFVSLLVPFIGLLVAFVSPLVPLVGLPVAFVGLRILLSVAGIAIVLPLVQPPLPVVEHRSSLVERRGTQGGLGVALFRVDLPLVVGSLHAETIAQS
jgi:hypothetical protein